MTFPRRPRFRRAEKMAPMRLTPRDEEILRAVFRHRFLRSNQIARIVPGSRQQLLRRLQSLYHHRYLERPRCQLNYFEHGVSRSMVYGLGNRGVAFLRRRENIPAHRLDWSVRNRSVQRFFLEHALLIAEVMLAFEETCRHRGDVRLLADDALPLPDVTRRQREPFHWSVRLPGGASLGVIPDKVFALESYDGTGRINRTLYFLEADRGTMPVQRSGFATSSFARKLLAYEATWTQDVHRSRFGFSRMRVLTVTTSAQRLENLTAAAADLGRGKGVFLFIDAAAVSSSTDLLAQPWRKSDGSTEFLSSRSPGPRLQAPPSTG